MRTRPPASDPAPPSLPDTLRLGPVHLTVTDLARSVAFYERSLGLMVQRAGDGAAALGAGGPELVVLVEEPDARPAGRHAGLYHFALLSESREELAYALARLALTSTPIQGAADHGVSEAIYLPDPDGNGIELYADRPRTDWPAPEPGARVGMYTAALDLDALLALTAGHDVPAQAGPGLRMGHVHLHVDDMGRALGFHRDVLGFALMAELAGAGFLSAGGYHHHLGLNPWLGRGIPPAPASGAVGLRHWEILLETRAQVDAVGGRIRAGGVPVADHPGGFRARDPAGIAVAVTAAA